MRRILGMHNLIQNMHLTYFLKTNLTKLVSFLSPTSSKITLTKENGKEKKKDRGEGKEEKRKKQWFHC